MPDRLDYTVGWMSAIAVEYAAAQEFLDVEHDSPEFIPQHNGSHYTLGKIGKHNVVMTVLGAGENGVAAAASAAKDLMHTFPNVRVCLMVGIGGGVPSKNHDIRLGDVVVSQPSHKRIDYGGVIQYDHARTIQEGCFQSARYLDRPPRALLSAMNGLRTEYRRKGNQIETTIQEILKKRPRMRKEYSRPSQETDVLYSSDAVPTIIHRSDRTEEDDNPMIHYGLIASADSFMEDSRIRDILARESDILCFEMEAAGLMNDFPCLVIRGICDYSDRHWSRSWRGYAAMAAAAYAVDLLRHVIPVQVEVEKSIGQMSEQMDPEQREQLSYSDSQVEPVHVANEALSPNNGHSTGHSFRGKGVQNTDNGNISIGGDFRIG